MTLRLGLIGFGKMGQAMTKAWQNKNTISSIDILDPHITPSSFSNLPNAAVFKDEAVFLSKAQTWDALILSIKPQTFDVVLNDSPALPRHLLVVSILAGKTVIDLEQKFGSQQPIIRAMPNTPAAIGKGMSVAVSNKYVTAAHRELTQNLFSALGTFTWANVEDDMDAITALSGSGPAYIFYVIECMAKAGIDAGLGAEFAMQLARQTVIGAAALAEFENQTPVDVLRQNVTSPNGTTAAGLSVLMDGKLQDIMTQTIAKATARSKDLSKS